MRYYKNIELSRRFGIGGNTVSRWIDASIIGKNTLEIKETKQVTNGKIIYRILSNSHNEKELLRLFEEGRSRNQFSAKKSITINIKDVKISQIVKDSSTVLTLNQFSEIINSLEARQLPQRLNSIGIKNDSDTSKSQSKTTKFLLEQFTHHLKNLVPIDKSVNIIDLGTGEFQSIKDFIQYLNKKKILNKYIAINISPEILTQNQQEATQTLAPHQHTSIIHDLETQGLLDTANIYGDKSTINLILMLDNTLGRATNQQATLQNIKNSMQADDLLLIINQMDSDREKVNFDTVLENPTKHLQLANYLGFETGEMELISQYDSIRQARVISLKMNKDYDMIFSFPGSDFVRKVYLRSSDQLEVWSHRMTKSEEIFVDFKQVGLECMMYFRTGDEGVGLFAGRRV